jgi:CDP-diacylglycerol--glycerol-3-phosphate 3-phosphatidyltransferase
MMSNLVKTRKVISEYITQPPVKLLARTPVTPNTLTWIGFLISAGAAALIITGHLFAAGFIVLVAGVFDMLDGALARMTNRATPFGGILDSTLDRASEAILLLGLLAVFTREQQIAESVLTGVVLFGSLMVSYLRSRIEAMGIECKIGLFTRPERVVILALGLLLSQFDYALVIALAIIAAFSFFTAGQRLYYAWNRTKDQGR